LWKKVVPVAQTFEHNASNAKVMGSIPRESKNLSNVNVYLKFSVSCFT